MSNKEKTESKTATEVLFEHGIEMTDNDTFNCQLLHAMERYAESKAALQNKVIGVWVKASERFPESKIWRKRFDAVGTYSLYPFDFIREEGEYMIFRTESILKTNVEWLDESQPQQKGVDFDEMSEDNNPNDSRNL